MLKSSNASSAPGTRHTYDQVERRKGGTQPSQMATNSVPILRHASFVSQDRADLGAAVKSFAQKMWRPSTSSMEDLKRLGHYLLGRPSLALRCEQQRMPANIRVSVDSDFAADRAARRSTTGVVQRLRRHPIKTTLNLQTSVGLNVTWTLSLHARPSNQLHFDIESDSSRTKAFASRRGLGQRHVQTRYL